MINAQCLSHNGGEYCEKSHLSQIHIWPYNGGVSRVTFSNDKGAKSYNFNLTKILI